MFIDFCLNNVRCDTGNCHNFAYVCVNTSGYKGNICLCKKCFNQLTNEVSKIKKIDKSKKEKD